LTAHATTAQGDAWESSHSHAAPWLQLHSAWHDMRLSGLLGGWVDGSNQDFHTVDLLILYRALLLCGFHLH